MTDAPRPVAVVTGSAHGMGRAHVIGLVDAGFRVVALDRDAEGLARLDETFDPNAGVLTHCVDVTDDDAVRSAFESIRAQAGRIDVLVNNAGGALSGAPLAGTSLGEWDATIRLNLTSQFLCIRAALPAMTDAGCGSIINIASTSVFTGITAALHRRDGSNLVSYVAAKGGVIALTRALARELGPNDIRVNAVAPGFTPTERVRAVMPQSAIDRMTADQAFRRAQQLDDATGAVVFLASPAARFVTGQVIRVDGGGSMG